MLEAGICDFDSLELDGEQGLDRVNE